MQLTILGCWSPYPAPGGACSGYLIQNGETSLLLEAGSGSFSKLGKQIDFRRLAAVIVTHLHEDHYLDLFLLRRAIVNAIKEGKRTGPLALFMPRNPSNQFKNIAKYTDAFVVNPIEELALDTLENGLEVRTARVGMIQLKFASNFHRLPAYAVSFDIGGGRLVFSGDTGITKELVQLAAGANLFLCEASGLDSDVNFVQNVGHLTARQAGRVAKDAGVDRLVITHLFPEYDLNLLVKQATEGFENKVLLAKEGTKFTIV